MDGHQRPARHDICAATNTTQVCSPSSPDYEPAWKVLILSSWLLLGRPAENASDANCANYMEARLDLFWSEDWPALWAMVRAECDVVTATQKRTKTKAERTETRIRKVATLARTGEKDEL